MTNNVGGGTPVRDGNLPPGPVAKICGLTRLEDVLAARALGAWALGFVFAPSPRRLAPEEARLLIREVAAAPIAAPPAAAPKLAPPAAPLTIGVFADTTAAEIARVVEHVGLDGVQLHGRGGPSATEVRDALRGLARRLAPRGAVLIIRAVPVAPEDTGVDELRRAVVEAAADADLVLLDTRTARGYGGTGVVFPWRLAREASGNVPLLVAGGIGPDNVRTALRESGAWGVDVSSGVESSPGRKDLRLMARLLTRVLTMGESGAVMGLENRREEEWRT